MSTDKKTKKSGKSTGKTSSRKPVGSLKTYKSNVAKLKETKVQINKSKSLYFKPERNTKYWMRILPAWSENSVFYKEIFPVWYNTADGSRGKVLCQNKSAYNYFIKRVAHNLGLEESEVSSKISLRSAFAMNIVVLSYNEKTEKRSYKDPTFSIWEAPKSVLDQLIDFFLNPEYGDFTDITAGYDVQVVRDDSKEITQYKVYPARQNTEIPEVWVNEGLRNLDETYEPATKEELEKVSKQVVLKD